MYKCKNRQHITNLAEYLKIAFFRSDIFRIGVVFKKFFHTILNFLQGSPETLNSLKISPNIYFFPEIKSNCKNKHPNVYKVFEILTAASTHF